MSTTPEEHAEVELDVITPVIVELGRVRQRHVDDLLDGEGPLADEVLDVLDEVVEELGEDLAGATLVPIVMVYERGGRRSRQTIELPF